jgi:hypothetical protein
MLCGSNDAIHIPEVFPGLIVLPKEYVPFNEAAIPVQLLDCVHILLAKRFANHTKQVAQDVLGVR